MREFCSKAVWEFHAGPFSGNSAEPWISLALSICVVQVDFPVVEQFAEKADLGLQVQQVQ